ncbi:hypothetical protein ZHAS_00020371 [Anopheles sinensis]|uniref:Uncharacterized protein n=1 Tax=Anopheles sinensis TaxID=74873 RepID=A0A084WPW2_ANOSI|nr:hypothetical protein ZHAS_00020371 [Anopheles sinensis]
MSPSIPNTGCVGQVAGADLAADFVLRASSSATYHLQHHLHLQLGHAAAGPQVLLTAGDTSDHLTMLTGRSDDDEDDDQEDHGMASHSCNKE